MRPSRSGFAHVAAFAALFALVVAGCGMGAEDTIRIGIISDCRSPFASFYEQSLAGAELPLIQRGARLRGPKPSAGVGDVSIAGKHIELVFGCELYGSPATT